MDINVLVIWFMFLLIGFLIILCIKIIINGSFLNKLADVNCKILSNRLQMEMESFEKNKEKMELVDHLNEILFKRLIKITKDLLSVQKLVFEKRFN
jgi:hypothetical protein